MYISTYMLKVILKSHVNISRMSKSKVPGAAPRCRKSSRCSSLSQSQCPTSSNVDCSGATPPFSLQQAWPTGRQEGRSLSPSLSLSAADLHQAHIATLDFPINKSLILCAPLLCVCVSVCVCVHAGARMWSREGEIRAAAQHLVWLLAV